MPALEEILYFSHNDKSSVLLMFFMNSLIFSSLLLVRGIQESKRDSQWLAAFIFLGGLYICPFMLGYAGWYGRSSYREYLFFITFQQLFLIGPVFYFYVQTLLNSKLELTRKDLLHFLPAAIYLIYSLFIFIVDKLILEEFYFYADDRDKDLAFWYQMSGLVSMLFYLFLSLRFYQHYRKLSLQEVSFADEIAFKWVKNFAIAFGLILLLRVLFFVLNPEWGQFGRKYWYYLCFSILLMYISITGYSNTIRTTIRLGLSQMGTFVPPDKEFMVEMNPGPVEDLGLKEWKNKIIQLFEIENVYQNTNLTLTDLARQLNTNRNIISKSINQEFGMNFNDFVNERRAEAVITKLKNGEHKQNTLLGIALDCGFNSKTTFNSSFKKHTGSTPKQFIEQHQL